jgi:hypothetical protein
MRYRWWNKMVCSCNRRKSIKNFELHEGFLKPITDMKTKKKAEVRKRSHLKLLTTLHHGLKEWVVSDGICTTLE